MERRIPLRRHGQNSSMGRYLRVRRIGIRLSIDERDGICLSIIFLGDFLNDIEFFRNFAVVKLTNGVLRSPVARLLWEQEVAGSNPVTPTMSRFIIRLTVLLTMAIMATAAPVYSQVPFERGMSKPVVFVPKGEWITGVSVSYTAEKLDNYSFFILEGLNGRGYTFKVAPTLLFAFQDNLAAGGRFSYSRSLVKVDKASLVLSSDMGYDIDHLFSLSHSYGGTALFRNYISLGQSRRFAIFNEVQFQMAGGQSKLATGSGQTLSGTYQTNFNLHVGVTPGVMMMLNNYSAMEVNIGVLGFNYYNTKAVTDQIYMANIHRHSANFKINLFSITFGCMFYL